MDHIEFEMSLMDMLLAGDNEILEGLRHQYKNSTVKTREFTGAGFYTDYLISKGIASVAEGKTFQFGDIYASYENIEVAFCFVLFVNKGYLSILEGYTLMEKTWPDEYSKVILKYKGVGGKRNLEELKGI